MARRGAAEERGLAAIPKAGVATGTGGQEARLSEDAFHGSGVRRPH